MQRSRRPLRPRRRKPSPLPLSKRKLDFDHPSSQLPNLLTHDDAALNCASRLSPSSQLMLPLPPSDLPQPAPRRRGRKRDGAVVLFSDAAVKSTGKAPSEAETPDRSSLTTDHGGELAEVYIRRRRRRKVERKKKEASEGNFSPTQALPDLALVPVEESESSALDVAPLAERAIAQGYDTAILYQGPYPTFPRPFEEECRQVRDRLKQLHGPLEEYARHRITCPSRDPDPQVLALEYQKDDSSVMKTSVSRSTGSSSSAQTFSGQEVIAATGHPRERRSVLDSLVGTILSQNTTDTNSRRAFASLKTRFPTWEQVYVADPKAVEDAIRCGGLAEIKSSRILNILDTLHHERGKLCLEYVRGMSTDQIKLELSRFKGVGPKTVACVLMFHLKQDEFPVDTHVFRITKMLGWVPISADREKAYLHLNHRVPNDVKFDLHCFLVTHGKRCPRCAKGGRTQKPSDGACPLVGLIHGPIEAPACDVLSIETPENFAEE